MSQKLHREESGPFEFQKKGFLQLKKFRKDALHKGSFSKPNWIILKDSFLLWYKTKPSVGFDIYPDGCLPMGGCVIDGPWPDKKHGGFVFRIGNKGFNDHSLVCRTRPSDTEGNCQANVHSEDHVLLWIEFLP